MHMLISQQGQNVHLLFGPRCVRLVRRRSLPGLSVASWCTLAVVGLSISAVVLLLVVTIVSRLSRRVMDCLHLDRPAGFASSCPHCSRSKDWQSDCRDAQRLRNKSQREHAEDIQGVKDVSVMVMVVEDVLTDQGS